MRSSSPTLRAVFGAVGSPKLRAVDCCRAVNTAKLRAIITAVDPTELGPDELPVIAAVHSTIVDAHVTAVVA